MIHTIYSTLPSFKNMSSFKPGLNVLLAQKAPGASNKQTRNRAGKSSFVEIINFLTGATVRRKSIFSTQDLTPFSFGMNFDLADSSACVERSGGIKSKIHFNEKEITHSEWIDILGEKMFGLHSLKEQKNNAPTFRSLFSYFVRSQASGGFVTPEKSNEQVKPAAMQTALMFLLGLDWKIAKDWQLIRDEEKQLQALKKAASAGTFGSIIGKAASLRAQLTIKEDHLKKLQIEIANFQVLPEYHNLEAEASEFTQQLNKLANENIIDIAAIQDLENAMSSENPPALENLEAIYKEAGIVLPNTIQKHYNDVESFHNSVIRNRRNYLQEELNAAKNRIALRDQQKPPLDQRRSEIMGILKSHGALEQFAKLQGELSRLESEVASIRQRFETAKKLESTSIQLKSERSHLEQRLRRDLDEQAEKLSDATLSFENISKRLYESAGRMEIHSTSNGPVLEFPMEGSRSKGIKNMQIFCFDMMLMHLCAKRGIGPGFLVHDSHLFDGVDGRQIISALRIGAEVAEELGFQYIVTMNEDDAFKETVPNFDLQNHLLPIRLTDATEDGGLFGIRFG